ncbi:MAG TPA: DUF2851 family protein [Saprospiraceae bacterium]|nr:DUF2851 family protein [Saprospiraceae bacterium]
MIREDFLHYIWKLKKFDFLNLLTSEGQTIQILDTGFHNTHAGPDFLQAHIIIGDILWVGSVEIHVKSSDWYKHHHQDDSAYNNVILHVVLEDDMVIIDSFGLKIPCLELKKKIFAGDVRNYHLLQHENLWIPCAPQTDDIPQIIVYQAIEKATLNRIIRKSEHIIFLLNRYDDNWEQVFLILLFRYFGTNVNNDAFEMLAKSFDPLIILREKDRPQFIEALLFGQSGLLNENFRDEYPVNLLKNHRFLQKKYGLKPIPVAAWKLLRLRPDNFPTIRIAQLAAVLSTEVSFFSKIIHANHPEDVFTLFLAKPADYWINHYLFERKSKPKIKITGKEFIQILIINVIVPLKYVYGEKTDSLPMKQSAIQLLEQIRAENNQIIKNWKILKIRAKNAFESQGLIELKNNYCSRKKCLECPIGHHLMKRPVKTIQV